MPKDPHAVAIARLSLKQGVLVAAIVGAFGIATALISTGVLRPRRGEADVSAVLPTQQVKSSNDTSFRDPEVRNQLVEVRRQLAEALKVPRSSNPADVDKIVELRRDLYEAQQDVRRLSASDLALKSNLAALQKEYDELKNVAADAPEAYAWSRQALTDDEVCISNASAVLKTLGSDDIHYVNAGVSGGKDGTLFVFNCEDTVMIMAVSMNGTDAEQWRDKLRDAFLAQEK